MFVFYFFIYSSKSYDSYINSFNYTIYIPYKGSQVIIAKYFNKSLDQSDYLDYINETIPSLKNIQKNYAVALIDFLIYPEDALKLQNLFGSDISIWLSFDWANYSTYKNNCQWYSYPNVNNYMTDYFNLIEQENSLLRKICFNNTAYIILQEPYNDEIIVISTKTTITLVLIVIGLLLFMILSFLCISYCKYRRYMNNSENEFDDFKSE